MPVIGPEWHAHREQEELVMINTNESTKVSKRKAYFILTKVDLGLEVRNHDRICEMSPTRTGRQQWNRIDTG
eukprot:495007-Hanusia_phi.AAC.2